jgi:hypothetical protein
MKISAAVFGIVLEITFIVYCIYMIYLLDVLDPFPREWMIPNMLIGAGVLAVGFFIASRMNRRPPNIRDEQLSDHNRLG